LSDERGGNTFVGGGGDSGVMYGCFELAEQIESAGRLPENLTRVEEQRFASDAEILSAAAESYKEKTDAAIFKGLYDRLGRAQDLERMLDHLEISVASYRRLCEKALKAYRAASDLAGVLGWEVMLPAFQDEFGFYKEQKTLSERGAEILCLGVNGPLERNDSQFCPLILERAIGTGRVAIMQIGQWQREFAPHQQFCATIAANIFVWAGWQSVNRS